MADERAPRVTDLHEMQMESGVSAFTGDPFVLMRVIDTEGNVMVATVPTADARAHALVLLECAEAAECDRAVFLFSQQRLGADESVAGGFVAELRTFRHDMNDEDRN